MAGRRTTLGGLVAACALVAATLGVTSHSPAGAATSPNPTLYVGSFFSGILAYDISTGGVAGPLTVGDGVGRIAITPDGSTVYAPLGVDSVVAPVDVVTNTPGAPIAVGVSPSAVAITPDGASAYVANTSDGTVSAVDVATNTVVATIPVPYNPGAIAITPDGASAYVVNVDPNSVVQIDVATNTVVDTIGAGNTPNGIAITPDGARAYVTNSSDDNVSVIDVATNTVVDTIPVGDQPFSVAITPDGAAAFVTNIASDNLTPIDTATNAAAPPIAVDDEPSGLAITPDGSTLYVAHIAGTVRPLDLGSGTLGPNILPGLHPFALGLAVTPDQAPVAALSATPSPAGEATTLDASASTVAQGTIASYEWDFGDGSPTVTTATPTTTHVYTAPGDYTATVTETSSAGTSTAQVFTGQTMYRNGGPSAVANRMFTVPSSQATVSTECGPVTLTSDAGTLASVDASPVPDDPAPPALLELPCGLIGFDVENLAPGADVTITVTLPAGTAPQSYWKLQDGEWHRLADATVTGDTITFTLTDGGTGDADGTADGTVVDPGGPAVTLAAPVIPVNVTPTFTG